jgi:hypothetical protein
MIINSSNLAFRPIHVHSHSCIIILKGSRSLLKRYADFKFVHIILNLAAIAFLWAEIAKFNTNGDDVDQCWTFSAAGLPCQFDSNGTLKFTIVYFVVGAMTLVVELCECFSAFSSDMIAELFLHIDSVIILFSYLKEIKGSSVFGTAPSQRTNLFTTTADTSRQDATRVMLEEGRLQPVFHPKSGELARLGDMTAYLQAQDHRTTSETTCPSDITDKHLKLEESDDKLATLGTDSQMTREELLVVLKRTREELATERLRTRMNIGRDRDTVIGANRPSRGLPRLFSTLSPGIGSNRSESVPNLPAYDDVV